MTPLQDKRWLTKPVGLRVRVLLRGSGASEDYAEGEWTSYAPDVVCVVLDGEEEPRPFHWGQVRPL